MSAGAFPENVKFEDWEAEQMEDPEFRAALLKIAFELPEVQTLVGAARKLLHSLAFDRSSFKEYETALCALAPFEAKE